jgi:molybdenum cofactor biosynthesis protein B
MPGRIDQNRPFQPVNIAILTVYDTQDASQDRSGDTLADLVTSAGPRVATRKIVRNEQELIVAQLKECIVDPDINFVI